MIRAGHQLSPTVTCTCRCLPCHRRKGQPLVAVQVEVPIEADEGVLTDAPLVFCYGHSEIMHNSDVYLAQVDRFVAAADT